MYIQRVVIHYFALNIWKKLTLHKHAIRKRKSTLIALSDNYWYSSLILSKLSEMHFFFKGWTQSGIRSPYQWTCLAVITLKSTGLSDMLNGSFTYAWFLTKHWSFWKYCLTELHRSPKYCTFYYSVFLNYIIITFDLTRKVFKYWEATKFMISIIQSYHRQHTVSVIFLEVTGSLHSFLGMCLQRTQAWIIIVCPSVILSSKNSVPQNTDLLRLATQKIMSIFSWDNHHTPLYNKSVLGILPILSFRV